MICFRCGTQTVSQQVPPRKGFERLFPTRKLFLNLSSHFIQEEIISSLDTSIQSWILPSPDASLLGRSCSYHYVGFQVVEVCLAQNCQLQDGLLRYFCQDIFLNIPACIAIWKADWSLRLTLVVQSCTAQCDCCHQKRHWLQVEWDQSLQTSITNFEKCYTLLLPHWRPTRAWLDFSGHGVNVNWVWLCCCRCAGEGPAAGMLVTHRLDTALLVILWEKPGATLED